MNPTPQIPHPGQSLGLPASAFTKIDPTPDAGFYTQPRLVNHIDDAAIAAITAIYRELLPPGGDILDLMSSWVSHLPPEVLYHTVTGLGMNLQELQANPRLGSRLVQDLNLNASLPFQNTTFDAAMICVSVQYLQQPIEVFREIARILRPGAPLIVSFSNRCFPTKAVAIWRALQSHQHRQLVAAFMQAAGFQSLTVKSAIPETGDPLWAVIGRAPSSAHKQEP